MGIVRLLIIGVVVWLAYIMIKRLTNRPPRSEKNGMESVAKKMVQCKECGLHIPVDEALLKGNDHFCCSEHRDQD